MKGKKRVTKSLSKLCEKKVRYSSDIAKKVEKFTTMCGNFAVQCMGKPEEFSLGYEKKGTNCNDNRIK